MTALFWARYLLLAALAAVATLYLWNELAPHE